MNNKQDERRASILELLIRNGGATTAELVEHYKVTSETIRKDLIYLEKLPIFFAD